jgi:signal transduction histidine kinase
MTRHGGLAWLRSAPQEGTEVRLTMPLSVRTSEESR